MATTTISNLPSALQALQTMTLPVDTYDAVTQTTSTERIDLHQILVLFNSIGNMPPTGSIISWPTNNIPLGHLEYNGQSFDKVTYPELGLIFPSGALPDYRGRVLKHAPAGRNAGETEEDQLKSHAHNISIESKDLGTKSVSNTDLGTKTTSNHGHTHNLRVNNNPWGDAFAASWIGDINWLMKGFKSAISNVATVYSNTRAPMDEEYHTHTVGIGAHGHTVALGSHDHEAACSSTGGPENTVKGVFVRFITRAK